MTQNEYRALQAELNAIERQFSPPLYLADELIDKENVLVDGMTEHHPDYWMKMYNAACSAAGDRAEALGADINELIGRIIY